MTTLQTPPLANTDSHPLRIIHLSDIHFGFKKTKDASGAEIESPSHHFIKGSPGKLVPDPHRLATLLKEVDAQEPPDLLVISGDIGWSGVDVDYEYAWQFIEDVRRLWKDVHIAIVPGNHDVDLSDGGASADNQTAFIKFAKKLYGNDFDATFPLLGRASVSGLSVRERLVCVQRIGDAALVIGVNTAAYINAQNRSLPIYVSADLLRHLSDYLAEDGAATCAGDLLRVFVMHHHLLPFVEPRKGEVVDYSTPPSSPDPTIVANSAQLQAWLAHNGFDLVLHGHKHMAHGRSDRLWRSGRNSVERHTFVVGAGTAGVSQDQIPRGEGLSLNQLQLNLIDRGRWSVRVRVRGLFPEEPGNSIRDLFSYGSELGPEPAGRPVTFVSQRMDLCHQAIAEKCRDSPSMRNFLSVVSQPEFLLPRTARIGKDAVTECQVENCFRVLHPEYEYVKGYGWGKPDLVQDRLRGLPKRFAFQHGPRIFGVPGRVLVNQPSPAERALQALEISETHGYLSLINTDTDVMGTTDRQPMPGLVGIQFMRRGRYLDLIATFRSLELSFWWVVNMCEACRLLHWAARDKNMDAGTITIFSPMAEWKENPRPSSPTVIDEIPVSELADLALSSEPTDLRELCKLIEQKINHTSVFDLDSKGLQTLSELFRMRAVKDGPCIAKGVAENVAVGLSAAVSEIEEAIKRPKERVSHVAVAERFLREALALLQQCGTTPIGNGP
jgi:3',5'-cyclic AMP phosphodiesterase CpdA